MSAGSEDFFARLGFDARAIIIGAERANTALGKLTAGTLALAKATSRYNTVAEVQIRRLKEIGNTRGAANNLKKINTAVKSTATSFKTLSTNVKSASTVLNTTTQTLTKNVQSANKASGELLLSWRSVIRIFAVQLAHRTVALLTNAIRDSITAAGELSTKIAEVQTISQNNAIATGQWVSQLRNLSDSFSLDILDQTEAAYQALSSQVVRGAETFSFLADANRLALATVSSTADAVGILSATINAFELNVSDAAEISASFFKTIELGRLRLSEIAKTFGRVAVPASQLGIELNELQAALTVTTIKGVPAAEAMTFIRNVILKLIRPTTEMKKFFDELGVASGQAAIETFGFAGFLAKLEERTRGSATEIGKLFGRIRAIGGAMIFAGDGVNRFREALDAIKNSSVSFQKSVDIILASTGTRFDIELSKIRNFFILDFGDPILETVLNVSESLGGLANVVKTLTQTFLALGAGVSAALLLFAATTPLGAAIFVLGSFATSLVLIVNELNRVADAQKQQSIAFQKAQIDNVLAARKSAEAQAKVTTELFKLQNRALFISVATIRKEFNKLDTEAFDAIKILNKGLKESFKDLADSAKKDVKVIEKALKDARKEALSLKDNVDALQQERDVFNFEISFRDLKANEQLTALQERLKDFIPQGLKLIDDGNLKLGRDRLDEARKIITRIDELQRESAKNNTKNIKDQTKVQRALVKLSEDTARKQLRLEEDLATIRRKKGNTLVKERNAQRKIDDLNRTTRVSLIKILEAQEKIRQTKLKEVDVQKIFNKLIKDQAEAEKKRSIELTKQIKIQEEQRIKAQLIADEFKSLQEISTVSIKTITDAGSAAEQQVLFDEREDAIKRTLALAKELGLTDQQRLRLTDRLERERGIVARSIAKERLKESETLLKTEVKNLKEALDERVKLDAAGILSARNVATLTRGLLEQIVVVRGDTPQVKFITGLLTNIKQLEEAVKIDPLKFSEDGLRRLQALAEDTAVRLLSAGTKEAAIASNRAAALARSAGAQAEIQKTLVSNSNKLVKDQAQLKTLITQINEATNKSTQNTNAFAAAANKVADALERVVAAQRSFKAIQEEVRSPAQVQGNAFGGFITRAKGGIIPQGTDSIPALLSPGEFVVNARSTKKFFNQLRTMNSGVQRFANGGLVGGNTTIGDINITAQTSGSATMDAVRVGRLLQREVRRGRLKI